jgi:hypothetical protein
VKEPWWLVFGVPLLVTWVIATVIVVGEGIRIHPVAGVISGTTTLLLFLMFRFMPKD